MNTFFKEKEKKATGFGFSQKVTEPIIYRAGHIKLTASDMEKFSIEILNRERAEGWAMGVPFCYSNELTEKMGHSFFVQANPDGSEDLVEMSYDSQRAYYKTIKRLCEAGKGKYYAVLSEIVLKLK